MLLQKIVMILISPAGTRKTTWFMMQEALIDFFYDVALCPKVHLLSLQLESTAGTPYMRCASYRYALYMERGEN